MLLKESKIREIVSGSIDIIKMRLMIENRNQKNQIINEILSNIPIDQANIDSKNTDKEILRAGILAELDAINLYEQMSAKATNKKVKSTLLDIANEEKIHVGEFQALLNILDSDNEKSLKAGKKEVEKD